MLMDRKPKMSRKKRLLLVFAVFCLPAVVGIADMFWGADYRPLVPPLVELLVMLMYGALMPSFCAGGVGDYLAAHFGMNGKVCLMIGLVVAFYTLYVAAIVGFVVSRRKLAQWTCFAIYFAIVVVPVIFWYVLAKP